MSILHTASMLILHVAKDCISKHSCWKEDCGKKHHTFLHEEKKANIKISSVVVRHYISRIQWHIFKSCHLLSQMGQIKLKPMPC